MRLLESFSESKHPDGANEDVHVLTGDFAAVIDGATDKSGLTYDLDGTPATSGRFAAHQVAAAVQSLPAAATLDDAVDQLTTALDRALQDQRPGLDAYLRPTCSIVLYSRTRHQVWSVGDCAWSFNGVASQPLKEVDALNVNMRAAVMAAHLAAGMDPSAALETEPGRAAIMPLLKMQGALANTTGPFSFGVLNGIEVPEEHRYSYDLAGAGTLTLASDGYPVLEADLAAAEATLRRLLAADPLCLNELRGTKAVAPGARSFDDRTWLRLEV